MDPRMTEIDRLTEAARHTGHYSPLNEDQPGGVAGYESLQLVLAMAYQQAALGKGKERHAGARPFHQQPMQRESDDLGSALGLIFQARKKIREGIAMAEEPRQIKEVLGAINYLAGWVIWTLRQRSEAPAPTPPEPTALS